MTSKKIWGAILIILGVLAVISGLDTFLGLNMLDNAMSSMPLQYSGVKSLDQMLYQSQVQYAEASQYARIMSVIRIVAGVAMAVLGTVLLRDEEKKNQSSPIDYSAEEKNKYDGWKI